MDFSHLPREMIREIIKHLGTNDLLRLRRAVLNDVPDEGAGGAGAGVAGGAAAEVAGGVAEEGAAEVTGGVAAVVAAEVVSQGNEEAPGAPVDADENRVEHLLQDNIGNYLQTQIVNTKTYYIGYEQELVDVDRDDGSWKHYNYMPMAVFLEKRFPIHPRRFHFDFREDEDVFYDERWMMDRFLTNHGTHLTHLSLSELWLPLLDEKSKTFFTTIVPTLKNLSVETLQFYGMEEGEDRSIPPFQNLTTLKIEYLEIMEDIEMEDLEYFWKVIESCTNLRVFTIPRNVAVNRLTGPAAYFNLGYQRLGELLNLGLLPNFRSYDLDHILWMDADFAEEGTFLRLCQTMSNRGKILENVHVRCLERTNNPQELQTIGGVIISMKEFILTFGGIPFPNLEKISIETSSSLAGDHNAEAVFQVPEWPSLKYLELKVDSCVLEDEVETAPLFDVLFNRALRPTVETLNLYGDDYHRERQFPLPAFVNISTACPNVTIIKIEHWVATDVEYGNLWRGLRRLQSITIHDCRNIGLDAFAKRNDDEPNFLVFPNLRKLRLIKLHNMVNITDDVFRLIFRHLPLEELILDSYNSDFDNELEDIASFSRAGIESLLTGEFANTIQRFPFRCFQLEGLTQEEMTRLGKLFRSSDMS